MDAKQACDKLNGFNFQNRYLVGMLNQGLDSCLDRGRPADMYQSSTTNPKKWLNRRRTLPSDKKTWRD